MAAELTETRRELIEAAAEDARLEVLIEYDGAGWTLQGPRSGIYIFLVELARRDHVLARVLADCISDGEWVTGTEREWRFPACTWGERPEDDDY